jgi:hypothetical protein
VTSSIAPPATERATSAPDRRGYTRAVWADIAGFGSFLVCLVGLIALQRGRWDVEPLQNLIDWSAAPGLLAFGAGVVIAIAHDSGTWATIRDVCNVVWQLCLGALVARWLSSWWFERRRRRA